MTPLATVEFRGLSCYASNLIQDDHLLLINLIGGDSMVKGIAAGIVEKPTSDARCETEDRYIRVMPKVRDAKYHMNFVKLADNLVNATVYHEALLPQNASPKNLVYLLTNNDQDHATETLWTFLQTQHTPMLSHWKQDIYKQLENQWDNGRDAWLDTREDRIGNLALIRYHGPEEKLDATISAMVRRGTISF